MTRTKSRRRLRNAAAVLVAVVGFFAAPGAAVGYLGDFGSWVSGAFRSEPDPSRAERVVAQFVRETKHAMPWQHPPTIFPASTAYFRRHFRDLNPERPHRVSIENVEAMVEVPDVAERTAFLQEHLIAVRGLLGDRKVTGTYGRGRVTSWAYTLYRRVRDRTIVVCRAPEETLNERNLEFGKPHRAIGVLIAEGTITGGDGKPLHTLYMACSALGVSTRITIPQSGPRERLGESPRQR
jgi:hypothetical protein